MGGRSRRALNIPPKHCGFAPDFLSVLPMVLSRVIPPSPKMAFEALHEVTAPELATLVLLYLRENAYDASATAFMHEAIGALRLIVPPKPPLRAKSLKAILNEYVVLETRTRQRAAFARAFLGRPAVRDCVEKMSGLLGDRAFCGTDGHNLPALPTCTAPFAPLVPAPRAQLANIASASDPGLMAVVSVAAVAMLPASQPTIRKRKCAQPQRLLPDGTPLASSCRMHWRPEVRPEMAAGVPSCAVMPPAADCRSLDCRASPDSCGCAGGGRGVSGDGCGDGSGGGSDGRSGGGSDRGGSSSVAERVLYAHALTERENSGAVGGERGSNGDGSEDVGRFRLRVDEMSVDEIVQSLLADPQASTMLTTFSRPCESHGMSPACSGCSIQPLGTRPQVATLPPSSHAQPVTLATTTLPAEIIRSTLPQTMAASSDPDAVAQDGIKRDFASDAVIIASPIAVPVAPTPSLLAADAPTAAGGQVAVTAWDSRTEAGCDGTQLTISADAACRPPNNVAAAAFPNFVNIDSFLSRLYARK
jgi:uncharacterized membrane protein YgcG